MTLDDIYSGDECGSCPCVKYYIELNLDEDCQIRSSNAEVCGADTDLMALGNTIFSAAVGFNQTSFSQVVIDNSCGKRDNDVCDCFWEGREAKLFVGLDGWPCEDYQTAFCGFIDANPAGTLDSLQININGFPGGLNTPVLADFNDDGVPLPKVFGGFQGFNVNGAITPDEPVIIAPVLTDPSNLIYQVNCGPVLDVMPVFDNGIALTFSAFVTDISAVTVNPGEYVVDLATGEIKLGAPPLGQITAGVISDGPITTASIIEALLTELGMDSQINAQSLADFNECFPYRVGLLIDDANITYLDLINSLMQSAHGWWGTNRNCEFEFGCNRTGEISGTFSNPTESGQEFITNGCTQTIELEDIQTVSKLANIPPCTRLNLTQRNWVTGDNFFNAGMQVDLSAEKFYPSKTNEIQSYVLARRDRNEFAEVLINTLSGRRECFEVTLMCGALQYERGTYVCVNLERYGLNKQPFYIEQVTENVSTMQASLRLCRSIPVEPPNISCNGPFSLGSGNFSDFNPADNEGAPSYDWSVSPDLPSNLLLDPTTGRISGGPIATGVTSPSTEYTITARNSAGESSCAFELEING